MTHSVPAHTALQMFEVADQLESMFGQAPDAD
jgi:hypothetical protein